MALSSGTRVGPYEIVALLGAGGMGEVYRARDAKLQRDVAIKTLPELFALDRDRRARFEREAQLLASINHPHIAAIYGFEEFNSTGAIVMELVDGPTLADRIQDGPLPLADALSIARQLALALDAAHEKGIVHRDLKPANVKLSPDRTVKVLDFGLAKALGGDGASPAAVTQSPTLSAIGTRAGVILGTAAYMSPEQARGQAVDKRTDIWAFGCVLYESLTGQRAFDGDTVSDVVASILTREPDWSRLPANVPPAVDAMLRHCLEKDPRRRLRDIGDAFVDSAEVRAVSSRHPMLGVVAGMAGGAALTALLLSVRGAGDSPTSGPAIGELARLTFDSGLTTQPAISADGHLVAYASDRAGGGLDIWLQQTTAGGAIRLTTDPTDDHDPDVSPDGRSIAFRSERNGGGVYVMPTLGGDARLIARAGRGPRFSPDGQSIAYWVGGWLAARGPAAQRRTYVVAAHGGESRQVALQLRQAGDPVWSPDSKSLLVHGRGVETDEDAALDWWWVPLDGRPPVKMGLYPRLRGAGLLLDSADWPPYPYQWTTRGVLFSAGHGTQPRNVWIVPADFRTGALAGNPTPITTGPGVHAWASASREGRLVFTSLEERTQIVALPLDANAGRATGALSRVRRDELITGRASVSADGRIIAFPVQGFTGTDVWIRDIRTGSERLIAVTPALQLNVVISRDGRRVAYSGRVRGGSTDSANGVADVASGASRSVCDDCVVYDWFADGRRAVVAVGEGREVVALDIDSGARTPLLPPRAGIDRPTLSRDDRWVAFTAPGAVYVAPVSTAAAARSEWRQILRTELPAERHCGWSPDGRLLYVLLERDGFRCLYTVPVDGRTGRAAGEPRPVHHFHASNLLWGSTGFGSAVIDGLFLANLFERTGNIWITSLTR